MESTYMTHALTFEVMYAKEFRATLCVAGCVPSPLGCMLTT